MAIEVFNRYEHKYLLTKEQFNALLPIIEKHMEEDKYNIDGEAYTIANIYYDTADDYLIRKSLSRPAYKEKLRLRSYGIPDSNTEVFLEIKKKYRGLVNKRRTVLKLDEAYAFINTGNLPEISEYMNKQVLNELDYFIHTYELMPKVYLAYDRIAYFEKGNSDLRVSFDTNIRSRRYDVALEKGDYGSSLLDENIYLMEIKTAFSKPLWLVHMLTELDIKRSRFSKYGTEFGKWISEKQAVREVI